MDSRSQFDQFPEIFEPLTPSLEDHLIEEPYQATTPRAQSLDVWQRLSRLMVAILIFAVGAILISMFWPEFQRQNAIEAEIATLTEQRDQLLVRRDSARAEATWLANDPQFLEAAARDRLNLRHEGEQIIRIQRK